MIKSQFCHSWVTITGLEVKANIPPYVWMYNSGQIDVDIRDIQGCVHRVKTPFNMDKNTPEELVQWLEKQVVVETTCKVCNTHILFRESDYRKSDECEVCALKRFKIEYAAEEEKELKKEKAEEARMLARGYMFKIIAWVHPPHGDDYAVVWFTRNQSTEAEIHSVLKRRGSKVMDDHSVKSLTTGNTK